MTRPGIRTGLLGGSFDPPHLGHLRLGELAWATLGLDEVRFVPSARPPHKAEGVLDGPARAALLGQALAGAGYPCRVDPIELERPGPSFTVDTLEALAAREPDRAWVLILGWDELQAFPAWRRPERILALAALAAAPRPGVAEAPLPPLLAPRLREAWSGAPGELLRLPSTGLALASRDLRAGLGRGETPEGLPAQVQAAILRENQYR